VHYGLSVEEMYDLPLWRMLRQYAAMQRWIADQLLDRTLSNRAAQAQDTQYKQYLRSLGMAKSGKMPIVKGTDAARFGLEYRKESK